MKKNTLLKRIQAVLTASTLMMGMFLTPGLAGAKEIPGEAAETLEATADEPGTETGEPVVPETETEEPVVQETETEEPQQEEPVITQEASGYAYEVVITGNDHMGKGTTQRLTATVYTEDGSLANNQSVEWNSGDENIATVDQSGLVKPIKDGDVKIFATALDGTKVRGEFKITVGPIKVESLIVNCENPYMVQGGPYQWLTVEVLPADAAVPDVVWSSNASSVATVDQVGKVEAKGPGVVTITAATRDGSNIKGSATIYVQPKKMKMKKPARVSDKTREVKLTWETITTGTLYEIEWSKGKNFDPLMKDVYSTKIKTPSTSTTKVTVKKDGKWFFRIRCIKTVKDADGRDKPLEGEWSKPKKLKVKLKTS